ncbi:MAG: GlxA family transcriptional regulator [Rhodobacteraceae bacterium]|nr:MAG: GlxA family transcriptional regulator [Paracoccaceae bacterium]
MMDKIGSIHKKRFIFLLLDNFSLISYACAVEPLRLANRYHSSDFYEWKSASENGKTAECSAGTNFQVDMGLEETNRGDTIIICGGINVKDHTSKAILNWLRREARRGVHIGALCTASYVLAKAGLLNGKTATIHWENYDSFEEEFDEVALSKSVFVVDENRSSSAGGIASIDLILRFVSDDLGQDLANTVADQLIYNAIRTERDGQRLSIPTRIGVRHPKLSSVIQMMEKNIEEPISPSILAREVGMSTRQLERLFRRYLNRSPKRYYMELRLQKARNLLMQTEMSVINVALACGFASPSHFSKCYRSHYNTTPYRERGSQGSRNVIVKAS